MVSAAAPSPPDASISEYITTSSLSAKMVVAEPCVPISAPAISSGPPTVRFQNTDWKAIQLVAKVSTGHQRKHARGQRGQARSAAAR